MRKALIQNGVVTQILEVGPSYIQPPGTVLVASNVANIGDAYDGAKFTPPDPFAGQDGLETLAYNRNLLLLRVLRTYDLGGVSVLADAKPETRTDLADLARWGAANPSSVRAWIDSRGTSTPLTGAQYVALSEAVGSYVLDLYAKTAAVVSAIKSGTITKAEQVIAAVQ